ncbi:MAG: helix-turn-helix transcriptional regulator [Candidatus Nanopelagicales bacterium]
MASRSYQPPASFVAPDGLWPTGPFTPGTPTYAIVTAALVVRLQSEMADRGASLRAVAGPAGIDPTSLSRLITGKVVPDVATIANLEQSLDVDLWPGRVP